MAWTAWRGRAPVVAGRGDGSRVRARARAGPTASPCAPRRSVRCGSRGRGGGVDVSPPASTTSRRRHGCTDGRWTTCLRGMPPAPIGSRAVPTELERRRPSSIGGAAVHRWGEIARSSGHCASRSSRSRATSTIDRRGPRALDLTRDRARRRHPRAAGRRSASGRRRVRDGRARFRIVGQTLGISLDDPAPLADGAGLMTQGLPRLGRIE